MRSLDNVLFFLKTTAICCLILATGTLQYKDIKDKCSVFVSYVNKYCIEISYNQNKYFAKYDDSKYLVLLSYFYLE